MKDQIILIFISLLTSLIAVSCSGSDSKLIEPFVANCDTKDMYVKSHYRAFLKRNHIVKKSKQTNNNPENSNKDEGLIKFIKNLENAKYNNISVISTYNAIRNYQ